MANDLNSLLARVAKVDSALAVELQAHIAGLSKRREFGLNFEKHRPETVELYGRAVRRGDKVRFVAPRSSAEAVSKDTWLVESLAGTKTNRTANLVLLDGDERTGRSVDDLVVVADFKDPIYPGLTSTGRVERGGDRPYHAVINSENYHALEAMLFTYQGKVDVIYIDPPYNTGGKSSWLYNDDYVDGDDDFKHSKWLSFMERRLRLARKLLKDSGVIFVSIDDAEQHRLRMLLDQTFGEKNFVDSLAVEMSTTSGPKTVNAQQGTIVKNIEFVHIYKKSDGFDRIRHTPLLDGIEAYDTHYSLWLNDDGTIGSLSEKLMDDDKARAEIEKYELVSRGKFSVNSMDKLLAVSEIAKVFVDSNLSNIARIDRAPVSAGEQTPSVGRYIEFEAPDRKYLLTTLANGNLQQVVPLSLNYRMSDDYRPRFGRTVIRGDLWRGFHQDMGNVAKEGGVAFGNGKKPVRLIKQLIRWANNSQDALILDFFGGSGTTAHAVMRMNAEDGGCRRAVVVTNNEVAKESRSTLRKKGLRPSDPDWESNGVHEGVMRPRLVNAASSDESPANIEFFALTYQDPRVVGADLAFEAVAPLLWMRAGSEGRRIDEHNGTFDVADTYGVLFSIDSAASFVEAINKSSVARIAYIVTDDERQFQRIAYMLPAHVETVRLYESYLRTFEINTGKE